MDMDIDNYSRNRSRSPVRDRSRSPGAQRDSYRRRDYDSDRRDSRRYDSDRNSRRGRGRARGFQGRNDRNRSYTSQASPEEAAAEYRNKTDRNYDNSVFIGNIPYDVGPKEIKEIFGSGFHVRRADIVTNRGRSRGMATVEFSTKEEVKAAIEQFDQYEYNGRRMFVRQDYPPPEEKRLDAAEKFKNTTRERRDRSKQTPVEGTEIFIGNLPFSMAWQSLKDLMREVGEVERADVRTDRRGKSMGYGTVIFKNAADAQKAIDTYQGYEVEGRKLDVRAGKKTPQKKVEDRNTRFTKNVAGNGPKSDTIYVANLPFVTSVDDLYELFETIGKVTRAELQYNPNGKTSGNAVVRFEVDDLAELAITNLHGYNYGGRDLDITYASRPDGDDVQEQDTELPDAEAETSEAQNADVDEEMEESAETEQPVESEPPVESEQSATEPAESAHPVEALES